MVVCDVALAILLAATVRADMTWLRAVAFPNADDIDGTIEAEVVGSVTYNVVVRSSS